jgi:hypothetical protein
LRLQIALCGLLMALPIAACAQTSSPSSQVVWANDHARFVIQSVDRDGKLTGTYQNIGSAFSCAGLVYPVTGWIDGDRISFTAVRKDPRNCGALQTWTGFVRGGELSVQYLDVFSSGAGNAIRNGNDLYQRQ